MPIVFCFLAVICFAALFLVVGFAAARGADPHGINVAVFLSGSLLSAATAGALTHAPGASILGVGAGIGVTAGIGMLGITLAARAGASATIINTFASLAIIVPIALSLLFLAEVPSPRQAAGVLLAALAIALVQRGGGR